MYRSLLKSWLRSTAARKVRDEVARRVAQPPSADENDQRQPGAAVPHNDKSTPCRLGVVFALGIESGGLEDLLDDVVATHGGGFVIRQGTLKGQRVALILSEAGQANAARATEILVQGHHPQHVISAGLAGGLAPELKRNDIVTADRLIDINGGDMPIELPPALSTVQAGVHRGALLTVDRMVRLPEDKKKLAEQYGALAVDMETFAVAEICRRMETPFSSIRVINDTAADALPADVEYLLEQKSGAARVGAALGAVWRRPSSAKDMYQLRENALVASDRLAKFIAENMI